MSDQLQIPVAPGELLDKITILEIKSERIKDTDKLDNVRTELALLGQVWDRAGLDTPQVGELRRQLGEINLALWDIEDDIRACEARGDFGEEFIRLARAVYRTNDRRAAVKKSINAALGSEIVEEKSYQEYDA